MNRILVFGVFDGVHDGHRAMLKEAKCLVESKPYTLNPTPYLIVAVAPDSVVAELKGKLPKHTSAERIAMLKKERIADEVTLGDAVLNSWAILKKYKPTTIALGYDQEELRSSLEERIDQQYPDVETEAGPPDDEGRVNWRKMPKKPRIVILSPHKPETHHNRILKNEV